MARAPRPRPLARNTHGPTLGPEGEGQRRTEETKNATQSLRPLAGHGEGRRRDHRHAKRHAQGHALFIRRPLRRREGNESGGTDRRRARRLLHDGPFVHAQQRRLHRGRHRYGGHADARSDERRLDHQRDPPDDPCPRRGYRRREVRRNRRERKSELSRDARAQCDHHHGRAPGRVGSIAMAQAPPHAVKGRGATFNPENRFRRDTREAVDDGWQTAVPEDEAAPPPKTIVTIQNARTIIARNESPDVPFDRSINPYQGCEHGCIYCYARPSHAYLDLSPGLDFETRLFAKPNAAELLRAELSRPGYVCDPIALGSNTDPYQPIEREWKVTRSILEVLASCEHPFSIVTKSARVERDIDLIAPMAAKNMARVFVSVTTLDHTLARTLEPRATAPRRRLQAIKALADAGIPVGVLVAPVIPQLNDRDLEAILDAAAANGARHAGWVLLRL